MVHLPQSTETGRNAQKRTDCNRTRTVATGVASTGAIPILSVYVHVHVCRYGIYRTVCGGFESSLDATGIDDPGWYCLMVASR